jgi:hypothetical protein
LAWKTNDNEIQIPSIDKRIHLLRNNQYRRNWSYSPTSSNPADMMTKDQNTDDSTVQKWIHRINKDELNLNDPTTNGITLTLLTKTDDQGLKINYNNPKKAIRIISIMLEFIHATLHSFNCPDSSFWLWTFAYYLNTCIISFLKRNITKCQTQKHGARQRQPDQYLMSKKLKAISLKTRIKQTDTTEWRPLLFTRNSTAQEAILQQINHDNLNCSANILWALALREVWTLGLYTSSKRTILKCHVCS